MKKRVLFAAALTASAAAVWAATPKHENYIKQNHGWMYNYYDKWTPGSAPNYDNMAEDENFFIGRVKFKERFTNQKTQVNTALNPERKLLWWCPIGTNGWTSMPNYEFDYDAFSSWNYIDIYGNWTQEFLRMPGVFSDVAHKNGVSVTVHSNAAYGVGLNSWDNSHGRNYNALSQGGYEKLMKLFVYYGIDGIGFNSEQTWGNVRSGMKTLLKNCYDNRLKFMKDGQLRFNFYNLSSRLIANNGSGSGDIYEGGFVGFSDFFPSATGFFLNYNWDNDSYLNEAKNSAKTMGGSSWDVFAGMDQQGRTKAGWTRLSKSEISIGIWGAHDMNMIYQGHGEDGGEPHAAQQAYLRRQEFFFTGGTRNPVNPPEITDMLTQGDKGSGPKFHGVSSLMPAKSSLQELPFVTYFNLGNGAALRQEGEVTFPKGWYNIGMQDYLPTWRWWITTKFMGREKTDVPENFKVGFTHEDAWNGGSALVVYNEKAKTDVAYVQLFKTKFKLNDGNYKIKIRYKGISGSATMAWAACKEGEEDKEVSNNIGTVSANSSWQVKEVSTTGKGSWNQIANSTLALLGLKFTNATADFKALIGEISIVKENDTYNPILPTIEEGKTKILKSVYNGVDFKMIWNSTPESGKHKDGTDKKDYEPWYNEDVDTWYFNVYFQQENGDSILCTQTTSWAAYVVGAPADLRGGEKVRFGVQAVSTDGAKKTRIQWTKDWKTVEKTGITVLEDLEIDKPVIKANEEFTIKFVDPTHAVAYKWEIINPKNNNAVEKSQSGETSVKATLSSVGIYDVKVYSNATTSTTYKSMIMITGPEVGAMPKINELNAPKNAETNKDITATYKGRYADGTASQALNLFDPMALVIRGGVYAQTVPTTWAMWIKPESFNYGKYGINLMAKRFLNAAWAQQNWGNLWLQIYGPDQWGGQGAIKDTYKIDIGVLGVSRKADFDQVGNKLGFNVIYGAEDWGSTVEQPNPNTMSHFNPAVEGQWMHVAVTYDLNSKKSKMYINGKKVYETTLLNPQQLTQVRPNKWRETYTCYTSPFTGQNTQKSYYDNGNESEENYDSQVYGTYVLGGSNVYKTGFTGLIDDLQIWNKVLSDTEVEQAMNGYQEGTVPEGLLAYYNFEEIGEDGGFKNLGKGGEKFTAKVYSFDGEGGEQPCQTLVQANALTDAGCPFISGKLPIVTEAVWSADNGEFSAKNDTKDAQIGMSGSTNVKFTQEGTQTVTLTLKNSWGSDSKTFEVLVVPGEDPTGLQENAIASFGIYPNPFFEKLNLRFTDGGAYKVNVYSLSGAMISSEELSVTNSEIVSVGIDGAAGEYIVRVISENGNVLQSAKVIKK